MNNKPTQRILIADDEPLFLRTTGDLLRRSGYDCVCVSDAHAAIEALNQEPFDLVLSDLNMPGNLRLELLQKGREQWPHVPLIVVTGVPSLPSAIESIRLGIADYLLKPVKFEDLLATVERAIRRPVDRRGPPERRAEEQLALAESFPEIIGRSPKMLELFDVLERVAGSDANVLITGESGAGKEVVAKAIHRRSPRGSHNCQVIDCTTVPEPLFESVLFGHIKGSFTGAVKDQAGLLAQCHKGTAFLDEIGELPAPLQAKLLRVVQEKAFTPVGGTSQVRVDTRFICATNRDLELEVSAGRFRRDLFYRLAVIHVEIPPLRERDGDVALLAEHFLRTLRPSESEVSRFSEEVMARFEAYAWPGNIRELRNVVERGIALSRTDTIDVDDLPRALRTRMGVTEQRSFPSSNASRDAAMDDAERAYLISLLQQHAGNVSRVAIQADMSRQGVHKLLKRHGIVAAEYRGR